MALRERAIPASVQLRFRIVIYPVVAHSAGGFMSLIERSVHVAGFLVGLAVLGVAFGALAVETISDDKARRIALHEVPGTVIDIDREKEGGVRVVEVEVRAKDGRHREVIIDAESGKVLKVVFADHSDDDDDDHDDDDDGGDEDDDGDGDDDEGDDDD